VKNSVIPLAAVLGMVISAAPSAWPQTPQISVWKIDVRSESGESLSHYSAEIYGQLHQRMAADLDSTIRLSSARFLVANTWWLCMTRVALRCTRNSYRPAPLNSR